MKSKYSIRLYELLKSYENLAECTFEFEVLKKMLFAEKYGLYKDFRVKVLDIAIRETNDFSDIYVEYRTEKKGKKVDRIKFIIKSKKGLKERVEMYKKVEQRISSKQIAGQINIFVGDNDEKPIIDTLVQEFDL
jgi:plasmid replication initiation protein